MCDHKILTSNMGWPSDGRSGEAQLQATMQGKRKGFSGQFVMGKLVRQVDTDA